jgi:hypothetical protein
LEEKEMNKMGELIKFKKIAILAYECISSDIYHYLGWVVGAGIGMSLMFLFSIFNCRLLSQPQQYAVILSTAYAFIAAGCVVILLAIFCSLCVYTISFLYICYIYDNRTWVFVNAPLSFICYVFYSNKDNLRKQYETRKRLSEQHKKEFTDTVISIRDGITSPKDSSCFTTED